ncbi:MULTISPECIES: hypothetical protein [Exiguobacterium]|uniref:hypothetical protein n=1 Tax=Exiguobacterium TaxID=33986 RepID=UPI001BE73B3F|nr:MULTISPECIES: hypothetical protein [Exiguobacterium]MCT4792848.1 hypothetical protein [Exiguobacterium artemiae]
MPNETKFLSYKLPKAPEPVEKPASVYVDEETNQFRFEPFDAIDRKTAEYHQKSDALQQQVAEARSQTEQAQADYQTLVAKNLLGEVSDADLMTARQALKEQERLLADKEAMIDGLISSLAPSYDKATLHAQYHAEYVAYVRYLNDQALFELLQMRQDYVNKIEETFDQLARSIDVRKDSKRFIADLRTDAGNHIIQSPVPISMQLDLTQAELTAISGHDALYKHEG